jgi:hypothetical protein
MSKVQCFTASEEKGAHFTMMNMINERLLVTDENSTETSTIQDLYLAVPARIDHLFLMRKINMSHFQDMTRLSLTLVDFKGSTPDLITMCIPRLSLNLLQWEFLSLRL